MLGGGGVYVCGAWQFSETGVAVRREGPVEEGMDGWMDDAPSVADPFGPTRSVRTRYTGRLAGRGKGATPTRHVFSRTPGDLFPTSTLACPCQTHPIPSHPRQRFHRRVIRRRT